MGKQQWHVERGKREREREKEKEKGGGRREREEGGGRRREREEGEESIAHEKPLDTSSSLLPHKGYLSN